VLIKLKIIKTWISGLGLLRERKIFRSKRSNRIKNTPQILNIIEI